ncbi:MULTISPECIES: hypothetical protein [Pseudomonas]|uniref:hypothetical protein n=1 Tax=Pseudomonadaceae TaxID=135621 RepID=UPI0003FC3682|nr:MULTISPECIES: hypothetical protein [Pseudomonas]MDE3739993.1 hypothetical protein [Pseudomonas resinovorans]
MNKSMQPLTVATLVLALLAPAAWAGENDNDDHQKPQVDNTQKMNHGQMDHGQMQGMDHTQMQNMDHSKMGHGAMHPAQDAKPKADSKDDR